MKNLRRPIIDIKPPPKRSEREFFDSPTPADIEIPRTDAPRIFSSPIFKRVTLAVAVLTALVGTVSAVGAAHLAKSAKIAVPIIKESFLTAHGALENLETGKAAYAFKGAKKEIDSLERKADWYGLSTVAALFSDVLPVLQSIPNAFASARTFTEGLIQITASIEAIREHAFGWLMNQDGRKLTHELANIQTVLKNITQANQTLKAETNALGYSWGSEALSANAEFYRAERFLKSLLGWFTEERQKHVAVFFQNPSEMRPAGGFLGSYGDLMLTPDGVQNIRVWDIYDLDGQLDIAYVPPKELRSVTPRWGARDANWFFDFPTSAEKTLSLLEQSKIHTEKEQTFDGAIAINIHVLASLLEIVGPITLDDYAFAISRDNFLKEIQREVESGEDNKAGEPKRILKKLTPVLIEKLGNLESKEKQMLIQKLGIHLQSKDIMLYMRDIEMESYLKDIGVGGDVAELPEGGAADYLAVVSANIGGGKSDAFTNQHIRLATKIDESGRISNFLTIERTHSGDKEKDWWYRAVNKSFLKIFTPLGSRLEFVKGGEAPKKSAAATASAATAMLVDADIAAIEKTAVSIPALNAETLVESNKSVFSTWMSVPGGTTKKLEVQYMNPVKINLGPVSIPYLFVFDKQSGANTSLDVLLEAPPGYRWAESGGSVFNYVTASPPRRVSLPLTLIQDPLVEAPQP